MTSSASTPPPTSGRSGSLLEVPTGLRVTVAVVALQVLALLVMSVLQVINLDETRVAMSVTTVAFWVIIAVALALAGRGLLRLNSWARSPIVLAELVNLGLAWSFLHTPAVAAVLALASAAALVGIFAPTSIQALEVEDGA